jgi:hypothetical protein
MVHDEPSSLIMSVTAQFFFSHLITHVLHYWPGKGYCANGNVEMHVGAVTGD